MTTGKIPTGLFSTGLTDNVFNTHRDQITGAILNRITDIMATDGGIVIDTVAETDLQVTDAGGGVVNVKAGIGYDKFGQRLYLAADDSASGEYVGTVDLSGGVDLSTNHLVKIDVDNDGAVEIDCEGATPAATTIDEIVAALNAAGFGTFAFRADSVGNPVTTGAYLLVKSPTTGGSSEVEFVAPSATDATNEIFGLSEAAYPHIYNGGGGYAIPNDSTDYDVLIEYLSVESVIGNFEGGYPTGDDTEYTQRDDSFKITIQLSSVGPISDANQHELLLAQVSNTGGTLTLLDKRDDIRLRLKGQRQIDLTPPPAPVLVSLSQEAKTPQGVEVAVETAYIIPRWEAVTDLSGIREYIIQLVLTYRDGAVVLAADSDPIEHTLQGFDSMANELQMKIELPKGDKYDVFVAAKDNSLSQNISAFTNLGNIWVGSDGDANDSVVMPAISIVPITDGIEVDWPDLPEEITAFEYCWAFGGNRPRWGSAKTGSTQNSEFIISAGPGTPVSVRVRIRRTNNSVSNESETSTIAGGTVIGGNEKSLPVRDISVDATDDGKAARFQMRQFLMNPANIVKLAVDVKTLTLNSSARGLIRIYRDNQEAGAINITFDETGQHEVEMTAAIFTAGFLKIDCYDSQESGGSQAAFTADLFIIYAEGLVAAPAQTSSPGTNL